MIRYMVTAPGGLGEIGDALTNKAIPIEDPDAQAVLAYIDDKLVGWLVFIVGEEEGIMHEIYVDEEHRGSGIGTMLHLELVEYLLRAPEIIRIILDVPYRYEENSFFLSSLGYNVISNDKYMLMINLADIRGWDGIQKIASKHSASVEDCVKSIGECTDMELVLLQKTFDNSPWYLDIDGINELYDSECSTIFIEDGKVKGFLLCNTEDKTINVSYIYSAPAHPYATAFMMYKSANLAIEKYGDDMILNAMANSAGMTLVDKMNIKYSASPIFRYELSIR